MSFSISEASSTSKYFSASRFGTDPRTLVIEDVTQEEFKQSDGSTQKKVVVTFHDCDKGLVLNATNSNILVTAYGDKPQDMQGKTVTLFVTEVPFGPKMVPSIRVRIPVSQDGIPF